MSAPRSKSVKDRLKAAKLPERSLQVCLRGDLAAEFDDLERRLRDARKETTTGRRRVASKSDAASIVAAMEKLQGQMSDEMLDVRVRALPRKDWQALVRKFPPKKGHDGDEAMGVDLEGLMGEAIPECIIEPELDAEDWDRLNEVLSSADYDRLLNVVWEVNRTGVDVPKSRLASLVMAESDDDSK